MRWIILLLIAQLALFIQGCESKTPQNSVVVPSSLLVAPKIEVSKEPKSEQEIALFMLDIYEAYEKCAINLRSVKKILDEDDRG